MIIYAKSFAIIKDEADFTRFPEDIAPIVERMIHACGMVDLDEDIVFSSLLAKNAGDALALGAPIFTDCEMVRAGIIAHGLPAENQVTCLLNDPDVSTIAREKKTTRSAAQVSLWGDQLAGSVVVIGNAPTALFALLEALDEGVPPPCAVFACPVGFVGAAEAKAALVKNPRGVQYLTVKGRRGGSAMASAAINAVAKIARDARGL